MSEWISTILSDVVELVIDYRGKTPKKLGSDWCDDGYRALSAKNIKTGQIVQEDTIRYVDEELYHKWMKEEIKKGDILITSEAPFGQIYYWDSDEKIVLSQRLFAIRIKKEFDARYIYQYMTTKLFYEEMSARATGTTVIGLRQPELMKCKIKYPDIETQKKISAILCAIDRKRNNNVLINNNLYQQLDTIYCATYPYLPSDELPAGWNCVPLGTLCDSISIRHSFDKEKLIFLNTGDVENGHFLHTTYSLVKDMPGQAKKSIKTNDILYSEIRPVNRHFAFVNFQADDYVVSTKLMVIRSRGMDSRRLYHFLTTQDVINELQIEAESRSGTFPQIRFENIQRLPIIIAPSDIELQFTQILKDYYNMIDNNICENQHLVTLHDSILPKLISGELDVSELDI